MAPRKRRDKLAPQWAIDRADRRDLWIDPDDNRVKICLFHRGQLVKVIRASKEEAAAYLAARQSKTE